MDKKIELLWQKRCQIFDIILRNSLVTQKNGKYLLTFCNNYLHIICNMNYDDMEELKKNVLRSFYVGEMSEKIRKSNLILFLYINVKK